MAKSFYHWMKEQYSKEELHDICSHGVAGGFNGLIYYNETTALYEEHSYELHSQLEAYIDDFGSLPKFVIDNMGTPYTFRNAVVWLVAEEYSNQLLRDVVTE
jgi:hypothetical protein